MPTVTLAFRKLLVQRLGEAKGEVSINNNVSIKDIVKAELSLGTVKQAALRFEFEYTTKYEPKVAEIAMHGDLVFFAPADVVDSVLKDWKKEKKAPKEITTEVLNNILARCNIQALILSREMNLPSPIPLPKVQAK